MNTSNIFHVYQVPTIIDNQSNPDVDKKKIIKLIANPNYYIEIKNPSNKSLNKFLNKVSHISFTLSHVQTKEKIKISFNLKSLSKKCHMSVVEILFRKATGQLHLQTLIKNAEKKFFKQSLKVFNNFIEKDTEFLSIDSKYNVKKGDLKAIGVEMMKELKSTKDIPKKLKVLKEWQTSINELFLKSSGKLPEADDVLPAFMLAIAGANSTDLFRDINQINQFVEEQDQTMDFDAPTLSTVAKFKLAVDGILIKAHEISG